MHTYKSCMFANMYPVCFMCIYIYQIDTYVKYININVYIENCVNLNITYICIYIYVKPKYYIDVIYIYIYIYM